MQRAIWIITFFIILAIGYYWTVVDDSRTQQMIRLADSDDELSGDVNSTVEIYDRLEKKWIGTSKHVQTLQKETLCLSFTNQTPPQKHTMFIIMKKTCPLTLPPSTTVIRPEINTPT